MNHDQIDHLINIYLDSITSISNDAGWTGESMLARLIAFEGEIPAPTRNDQSNLAMIKAMRMLREEHAELGLIRDVVKGMLSNPDTSHKILALLSRHYYRGLCEDTGRIYTDVDRIKRIGYHPHDDDWVNAQRRFRRRVADAYRVIGEILEVAA